LNPKIYFKNIDDHFMTAKLPKDPYMYISKRTQKIEINKGMPYKSTSADEVLEYRLKKKNLEMHK